MSDPFIGEIRMFGGNFAPLNWAKCEGQLVAIRQNTALFSLLGAMYGGDGKVTFALPDFRGRVPVAQGAGPGLTPRTPGEMGGASSVALTLPQMPAHAHAVMASVGPRPAVNDTPGPAMKITKAADGNPYGAGPAVQLSGPVPPAGGTQAHNNRQPFACITFIIAMQGIYPPRP